MGMIREIGLYFCCDGNPPTWTAWTNFTGSDVTSGVAGVMDNDFHQHVYLRNSTTGAVQLWMWDIKNHTGWYNGTRDVSVTIIADLV